MANAVPKIELLGYISQLVRVELLENDAIYERT